MVKKNINFGHAKKKLASYILWYHKDSKFIIISKFDNQMIDTIK